MKLFSIPVVVLTLVLLLNVSVYSQDHDVSQDKIFDAETHIGDIITVTRGGDDNYNSASTPSGYLEFSSSNHFYCYDGRLVIIETQTHQGEERKSYVIDVSLNNESMESFIPDDFADRINRFTDVKFTFSCEKEAIWVLAEGRPIIQQDYQPPNFVFSFFAVPKDRNLQKFVLE